MNTTWTTPPTVAPLDESHATGAKHAGTAFSGVYLDGRTATKVPVTLAVESKRLVLLCPQNRRVLDVADVLPIHPSHRGVQFLRLADGATCELPASPDLLLLLNRAGVAVQKESAVAAFLHGDWRIAALALAFLAAVLCAFYVWLLPTVVGFGVGFVPATVQRSLGESALRQIEAQWPSSSQLSAAQQAEIQARFKLLAQGLNGPANSGLELLIRKSSQGPNAFALPGNFVVLTDELVLLVGGDLDAISGILAHELGHLNHQHGLRSVLQTTALTMVGSALMGDYSSPLVAIPAALGHLNYSRQFETEADVYSHTMLCAAGIDPAKTALFFDRVSKIHGNLLPAYLSTHPASEGRAAYFREACTKP